MIYLDYAANCPVDKKVLEDFNLNSILYYANPNSTHRLGLEAKEKIDEATSYIANVFKCKNENVIYTSGSSESNNLVIKGFAAKYKNAHIITTSIEHSSIIAPVNYLLNKGVSVDILDVNDEGKIDIEELENLIDDRTTLVSITSVESETGIIMDIEKIGEIDGIENVYGVQTKDSLTKISPLIKIQSVGIWLPVLKTTISSKTRSFIEISCILLFRTTLTLEAAIIASLSMTFLECIS